MCNFSTEECCTLVSTHHEKWHFLPWLQRYVEPNQKQDISNEVLQGEVESYSREKMKRPDPQGALGNPGTYHHQTGNGNASYRQEKEGGSKCMKNITSHILASVRKIMKVDIHEDQSFPRGINVSHSGAQGMSSALMALGLWNASWLKWLMKEKESKMS